MRKHIKCLLGTAGLLAVGGMTAVAANLPGPEAQAVEPAEAGTSINVMVRDTSTSVEVIGQQDNGDPTVKVHYGAEICSTKFQATNIATGDNLFNPEILYKIRDKRGEPGNFEITLPFTDYGAVMGDYTITVNAYDCNGASDPVNSAITKYSYNNGKAPDVPNTGEFNVLGVNLARADYLAIGGLIVAAAIACIILAARKKHHK